MVPIISRDISKSKMQRQSIFSENSGGNIAVISSSVASPWILLSVIAYVDLTRLANPFVGNHNVTKAKILTVGGAWTEVQYTFEYNDLGYPTKLTTNGLTTFITNYGYECK